MEENRQYNGQKKRDKNQQSDMHKTKYCAPRTLLNNGTNSYAPEE